jgi:hypothetical protein
MIKKSHSSIGRPNRKIPVWYRGLKPQIPSFKKMISCAIKRTPEMTIERKTLFHIL